MRIVVPVSGADSHLLPEFVELHQHFKVAGLNHSLHFVTPPSIQSEAHDARAQMEGLFESITVHLMDFEPYGGWPYGPNMQFWACADFMRKGNPALPWQLVELDCRLIRANAYDLIAAKYASCGSPYFGFVGKTPWRTDAGKITKSLEGDGDVMMSGCAVYPGNLLDREALVGLCADFMKGESSTEFPWDMHLRAAMKDRKTGESMAHTELIANHWNTGNYRIENGRLVGDALTEHEIYRKHPEWEKRDCGGAVHPDAVMVHGCKDDTLFNLVVSGGVPDMFAAVAPVTDRPAQQQVSATFTTSGPIPPSAADARIDKLEGMMAQMMQLMQAQQQNNSVGSDGSRGDPAPAVVASAHETKTPADSLSLVAKVTEALAGKQRRLGDLSKDVSTDREALREALLKSGQFTITGKPAEWVKGRAA